MVAATVKLIVTNCHKWSLLVSGYELLALAGEKRTENRSHRVFIPIRYLEHERANVLRRPADSATLRHTTATLQTQLA